MTKWASISLIALGLLHLAVLGIDAFNYFGRWAQLQLWTFEHWGPLTTQSAEMVQSNAAFWSTVGSFAVPTIVLGYVLFWLDQKNIVVPVGVGWGLLAWQMAGAAVMLPAGFILGVGVTLVLLVGL